MATKKDNKGRVLKQNEDQLKDGRYRYRYTDKYGKRSAVYAWKLVKTDKTPNGKKEDISLREKILNIEKDLRDGINIDISNITVVDLIKRYLDIKTQLANTTKNNYAHILEKNIKGTQLGSMKICDVKKSDILKYYSYLYADRKFKPSTIQLYQNLLFPSFQMAVDDSVIRLNPCRNCMKDYTRGALSSTKYPLSRQEQMILLDFVKHDKVYFSHYTLIAFMLGTGCRISESLGITWDDINFEEKYITVNHQVLYKKKDKKIQYYASLPKNQTSRIIPIQDDLVNILKKHRENTIFISKSSDFEVDGYKNFVFINRVGKLQTPNTIVRTFHGIRDAYNLKEIEDALDNNREAVLLPDFSPHTLRHTYCTRMAENGVDIKVLQEIMGHKTIAITMQVYNHATLERTQKAVQGLEPVLNLTQSAL